jgi:hypothetical protein
MVLLLGLLAADLSFPPWKLGIDAYRIHTVLDDGIE